MSLPTDYKARKQRPIGSGVLDYFPDALAEVAYCSFVGNEQHNPGTALHWDRSKSKDEADALIRHFLERGKVDTDGVRHSAKLAWRALALLQKEIESADKSSNLAVAIPATNVAISATPVIQPSAGPLDNLTLLAANPLPGPVVPVEPRPSIEPEELPDG